MLRERERERGGGGGGSSAMAKLNGGRPVPWVKAMRSRNNKLDPFPISRRALSSYVIARARQCVVVVCVNL